MSIFICPVCGNPLDETEKLYRCEKGHSFDKSKFGYVNLLMSQKSSGKRHGDDRVMVRARRDFLSAGYYGFLKDRICEISAELFPDNAFLLDAGCGECWYSCEIGKFLDRNGINALIAGIDISKDALEFASKRNGGIKTAVAGIFDIPVSDCRCDGVFNIFSPEAFSEFYRVLKPGGTLIRVIPLENHLFELKSEIYEHPYKNDIPPENIDGFTLIKNEKIAKKIKLISNSDIMNLFRMTPYYYKTGRDDQKKLETLNEFETRAEFGIRVYRKEDV